MSSICSKQFSRMHQQCPSPIKHSSRMKHLCCDCEIRIYTIRIKTTIIPFVNEDHRKDSHNIEPSLTNEKEREKTQNILINKYVFFFFFFWYTCWCEVSVFADDREECEVDHVESICALVTLKRPLQISFRRRRR